MTGVQTCALPILGIPADLAYVVEKRPVYVTRDGKGKVIRELLA